MSVFDKQLEQLDEDDLYQLQKEGVEEGVLLDYKADWIENKKLAKAVASFANTHGGHLVIGVAADKDRNVPVDFPGLELVDGIKEKVGAVCRSRISPAPVFRMKLIPLSDKPGRTVLVIEVPESPQPPHYVNGTIYVRNGESSRPLEPLRNFFLIEKLYEKRAFQEERVERFVAGRRVAHSFDKADYSLTLLTCPSLPGRSPLPLFRREFYHFLSDIWSYRGVKIEPNSISFHNEDRWQERTAVVSREGWIEQAAGVCFPARQRGLIQEQKLFDDILPTALERAIQVYSDSLVQYYGSLRVRVSLQGVNGRHLLLRPGHEDACQETASAPDSDPVVCDRITAVPHLYEASGRSLFVESIVREVRRAFGELVFEPEETPLGFDSVEDSLFTQSARIAEIYGAAGGA
jgi:schlafen family protein